MFKTILIPTDFSDCSQRALDVGLRLADTWQSNVVLLHASEDINAASFADYAGVETADAVVESATQALNRIAQTHLKRVFGDDSPISEDRIDVRVASGPPAAQILDVARELHTDLIVMGTHGRSGLTDKVLGSTAERVARRADCSVFTVKPEGYPFIRA